MADNPPGLSPEARQIHRTPEGTRVVIDGQAWLFAAGIPWTNAAGSPRYSPVWDRLFDHNTLRGAYDRRDIQLAALRLLQANYEVSTDEGVALIVAADPEETVAAVEAVMFVPADVHRTFGEWVLCSLVMNGIDPHSVPPAMVNRVMELLVETKRTIPAHEFINSVREVGARSVFMKFLKK